MHNSTALILTFLILTAFLLMLGACSVRTEAQSSHLYSYRNFVETSGGRDTLVVVHGNPFDMDQKAFEKAVIDAMQGQNWGPRTNFTAGPSKTARKDIRVVMLFNGPQTVPAHELCQAPERFGSVNGGNGLHVTAAYCNGGRLLTEVNAWTDPVAGTKAPNFARLVIRTTRELFPLPFRNYPANDPLRD